MTLHPEAIDHREIQQAVGDYKAALKRIKHGRVTATADIFDGVVIGQTITTSNLTHADLERLIRERPKPAGRGERP
jgi:hypothetical protein